MDKLTKEEQEFIDKIHHEMRFYDEYKSFMAEVKTIFLQKGGEAAKQYIVSKKDHILQIACDELFWSLFHKL